MTRTNVEEVKKVLVDTELTDEVIQMYINSAYILITQKLSGKLDETVLTDIEKWLACHFITATQEYQVKQMKVGDASMSYAGDFGKGLESTSYGQMVLLLDTTNTLQFVAKQKAKTYIIKKHY